MVISFIPKGIRTGGPMDQLSQYHSSRSAAFAALMASNTEQEARIKFSLLNLAPAELHVFLEETLIWPMLFAHGKFCSDVDEFYGLDRAKMLKLLRELKDKWKDEVLVRIKTGRNAGGRIEISMTLPLKCRPESRWQRPVSFHGQCLWTNQ